jgi:hypothetical protein
MNIMTIKDIQVYIKNKNEIVGAIVLIYSLKKIGIYMKFSIYYTNQSKSFNDILKLFFDNIQNHKNSKPYLSPNSLLINNDISFNDINDNLYYFDELPYFEEGKKSIKEKINTEEYIKWFYYYREILSVNFFLMNNKYFKEATKILKYFTPQLSMHIPNIIEDTNITHTVSKLYNHEITENELLYHSDISREYNTNYFYIPEESSKKNPYEYLKYNKDTFMILYIKNYVIDDEFKKYIFYTKKIILEQNDLHNLLFQAHTHYVYDERKKYIKKHYKDKKYEVIVIFIQMNTILNSNFDEHIYVCNENKNIIAGVLQNKKMFDYITLTEDVLKNLKFQSVKKWLYNNYKNIENINNLQVYWFKNDTYIIIDNTKYEEILFYQLELNKNLLFFMKIYFSQTEMKIINGLHLFKTIHTIIDEIHFYIEN